MPALAEHFTVVAADMRGMGASGKPAGGYDAVTLADEMTALMASLGHDSFHVAGYDMGMMVGYVLAARHRDRVTRLVLAEAVLAGFTPLPPLLMPPEVNELAWHFVFNRLAEINAAWCPGARRSTSATSSPPRPHHPRPFRKLRSTSTSMPCATLPPCTRASSSTARESRGTRWSRWPPRGRWTFRFWPSAASTACVMASNRRCGRSHRTPAAPSLQVRRVSCPRKRPNGWRAP
ncbi:alpha/beta fold hydrolase [Streptomyces olivaceus]